MSQENKINQSCWGSIQKTTGTVEEKENCPKCYEIGEKVKNITVKHMVSENLRGKVVDEETYYLCMNKDCDVVYYNINNERVFYKEEVKVPIWFKKNANPKYICYCNQVTEQQIINAVLDDGAKNIKDIIRLTGAMKNGKCEINNPLGKCCSPLIQETINKALNSKE